MFGVEFNVQNSPLNMIFNTLYRYFITKECGISLKFVYYKYWCFLCVS